MSTIFSKIIAGEIPSYKIYEDDKTFAFLDIHPETRGHTLIVPKIEVDKIYELPDEYHTAIWETARKLAKHMEKVLGVRTVYKVVGTDVPHAHIHLSPLDMTWTPGRVLDFAPEEMAEIAEELRLD
jgi:histidine triad (HIT) family protein